MTENLIEIGGADWHKRTGRVGGRAAELGVVLRHTPVAEIPIGDCQRRDPGHPELVDQPILEGPIQPLTAPPRLGRVGRDVLTINLRIDDRKRALIDRAAETLGKNRSEFMLDAACREATSVLLDQRLFMLDEKGFRRFTDALDKSPSGNPRLRRLLATKAPWER